MKKSVIIFSVFLCALLNIVQLSAQNDIVTTITPKVRMFPATGFSYFDDPGHYFNIQMVNTTGSEKQIYFTINVSCEFSATGEHFFVKTKKEFQPQVPITIGSVPVLLRRSHFDQIIGNLNRQAYEMNDDRNLLNDVLTLPEGQYKFCIRPYIWTGHNDANPMPAGEEVCYYFSICYSGSAPEFTSPVNGYSASNLNNSNPANNLLGVANVSSDNRSSDQYAVLPLQRTVNFSWTGVISNCLSTNDFNYTLKIVEVYKNQNIQDAINNNATIATIENKSRTTYLHDTLSNRHFRLQRGHVYAVQVQATLKKGLLTEVSLGNGGKSQVIAFVWGDVPVVQQQQSAMATSVTDNREQVMKKICDPYIVTPGQDKNAVAALVAHLPSESSSVPENDHYSTYMDGAEPYYLVEPSDTLKVKWMPVRGDSVFRAKYFVSLYEYVGGDVENSLNVMPIRKFEVDYNRPDPSLATNPAKVLSLTENWKEHLQKGFKYVLNLKTEIFYSYNQRTTYTITDYIHNMPTNRDSIVNEVMFGTDLYQSNVVFAWGIDSNALDKVYPPQFTYPVDLSAKDLADTSWTADEFPEVVKRDDFSFRWKKASGVDYDDTVYYKLSVGKLPKGKKPHQVKNFFFVKDSIVGSEYIDSTLFDTLKTNAQYVAVLEMSIKQMKDTSAHYNILNNGKSHYAAFQLKDPIEFTADLNNKIKCFPNALDDLKKEHITPSADSLIQNKVQLKMGNFPLVLQTARLDTAKHTYSGDGYVVWNPLGVDVRLKVKVDSIMINGDYQIIRGSAVSTATDSSTYLDALTNDLDLDEWSNDDINAVVSKLGENETVKGYYDKFKEYGEKYAKKYGGLLGPIVGENVATQVLTFPLSITDEEITGSKNVVISINNMYFSPVTALMNIWAIFAAQSDNTYVPFLANNICMDQQGLFGNSSQHIELFMGRDYEFELNDGYKMRFKKSSNFANPKDGTVIVVDSGKFAYMMAEIQFVMNSNDVMGIAADGTPRKGKEVNADLLAKIKNWDDWTARIKMDPFAVVGAEHYTFVPTGKGIFYDHSSTETPKEIAINGEYLLGDDAVGQKNEKEDAKKDRKNAIDNALKEWQGFYWDELTVFLSDEISNTFVDEEDKPKDSVVTYSYGLNGTIKDSIHYCYPGSRINFGAKQLIIDKNGFSAEIFARDILKAETKSGGGWAFSLDTISIKFLKNQYKHASIKGGFGIPLFSGGFKYVCSIGADSLEFSIDAAEDTLKLDMWLAYVNFDPRSSYFRIKKIYAEEDTRIDLTMNGKINVDFNKLGIPVNFSLAKFEHMGMRNYNLGKNAKPGTAKCDKFEFDIGEWSFASPQKTLGGLPSDGYGQQSAGKDPIASVSFAGFTFSLTKFDPIVGFEKTDLKIGFSVGGQMKFATEGTDLGASCGFSVWGIVEPLNKFNVKKVDSKLESITLDKVDFDVFTLEGKLDFFNSGGSSSSGGSGSSKNGGSGSGNSKNGGSGSSNGSENPQKSGPVLSGFSAKAGPVGEGFGGELSVTIMSEVTLKMSAGFGTAVDDRGAYKWWFFDGSCKFPGGIPIGAVSINRFSGGFAYNMQAEKSLTDPSYNAINLMKESEENTNSDVVKASGMAFLPARNSWVANAGIGLVLTGGENTLNADGLVSLRIANNHFSGVFIDANAYVMTQMDESKTPGDGSNNSSPLIRAKAIIGFEQTKVYDYFRLSLCVNVNMNLSKLLDGTSETILGSSLSGIHGGSSLTTNANVTRLLGAVMGSESGLSSHSESDRDEAPNGNASNNGSFSMSAKVPIDFELKHYKQKEGNHKKGSTDWYFAIGKPKYDERVSLSAKLDMKVCKAKAEFTFYMQTGNAFAYQMPELSADLKKFFGLEDENKKLDADQEGVTNARKLKNTDWLAIDKGGGFCLGSTFHAQVNFDCFLYVHVSADLGFDVALLDVNGIGCPGYPQIGKNNFYALGRMYAALQGDVGLKLNLGFWKGEISLFSAGIGALLQGGGPSPSYAYGLLRFKISMLNGLLKFSTSVDFQLGDVCVPGLGDPLANVNLFQNVTPGFSSETIASQKSNLQSPLQMGSIVSNMPWDKEVFLADNDGKNARQFYFTLMENEITFKTKNSAKGSYVNTSGTQRLKFVPSIDEANAMFFETEDGGFPENSYNQLVLKARAFEWRTAVPDKELHSIDNEKRKDYPYEVKGVNKGKMKNSNKGYGWFDPTFYDEKTNKKIVRKFQKDSTFYFKTQDLGYDLKDQVVYSWPYNGDRVFPSEEYAHSGSGNYASPYAMLYFFQRRDNLFDKQSLNSQGKELKIFLLTYGGEAGDIVECSYSYFPSGRVPYVKVYLPKNIYGSCGPRKLRFLVVEKNKYESAMKTANAAITEKKEEYSSRISNEIYTAATQAHNANNPSSTNRKGFRRPVRPSANQHSSNTLNLKNQLLEEIYQSKSNDGKDSMLYYRTKAKDNYKACASVGVCIYEWTWWANDIYKTYKEYFEKSVGFDYLNNNLSLATVDVNNTRTKVEFSSDRQYWVFLPYEPNDPKLYKSNVTLPPRFFLALKDGGDQNLSSMHRAYFQHFLDMERDFKQTPLMLIRRTDSKGDVDYDRNGHRTVNDRSLEYELGRILSNGFVANYTYTFNNVDIRIKGGKGFVACTKSGYHPTTVDVPSLLEFSSTQTLEPMGDEMFDPKYKYQYSISQAGPSKPKVTITDYATPAIIDDIKKFNDFMQRNQQHARALDCRGWSHKADYFKDFYSSKYKNAKFSHTNFPFDIPEIYIVTHYMTALEDIWFGTKDGYWTTKNDRIKLINKDNYFIPADELQLRDAMWAKYWWSSYGQCTDFEGNGFERDFYYRKSNTKYYNSRPVGNNISTDKNKRGASVSNAPKNQYLPFTKSKVLGDWYNNNWGVKPILNNHVMIYYMTSQASNFENCLMNIAYALKKSGQQTSRIFFPNASLIPNRGCYFNVKLNQYLKNKIDGASKLIIMDKGDATFNY